jgi:hypothetical protein
MSDDLVNQITLNFLISKQQLQKLNKKIKQKEEDKMKTDMEIYKEQFVELFNKMVNDDFPDNLLEDVKHSYTYFVEKSIYYLKMRATTNNTSNTNEKSEQESSDNERSEQEQEEESSANEISDNEISDNEISANDEELSDNEISDNEELSASKQEIRANDEEEEINANDEEDLSASNNKYKIKPQPQSTTIYKKVKKNTTSKGVDNIEQLPLDWFTKVRQTQKQHNIIPRKKDYKK